MSAIQLINILVASRFSSLIFIIMHCDALPKDEHISSVHNEEYNYNKDNKEDKTLPLEGIIEITFHFEDFSNSDSNSAL